MNGIMKMAFDLLPAKKMLGYLYQIGVITHLFTIYFLGHLRPASNSFRDNAWHAKTTQVWGVTEKTYTLQGGPHPVISGVITPINGLINGNIALLIGVISLYTYN